MHPDLTSRLREQRYIWTPLLVAVGAVAISLEILFDFSAHGGSLATGLLFIWIAWFYSQRYSRWAARANWVLETIPAIPMRVSFATGAGESGPTAKLVPLSSSTNHDVDVEPPLWDVRQYEGTVVQVHVDPEIAGLVIIRTDAGVLWPFHQYGRIPRALRIDAKGA